MLGGTEQAGRWAGGKMDGRADGRRKKGEGAEGGSNWAPVFEEALDEAGADGVEKAEPLEPRAHRRCAVVAQYLPHSTPSTPGPTPKAIATPPQATAV